MLIPENAECVRTYSLFLKLFHPLLSLHLSRALPVETVGELPESLETNASLLVTVSCPLPSKRDTGGLRSECRHGNTSQLASPWATCRHCDIHINRLRLKNEFTCINNEVKIQAQTNAICKITCGWQHASPVKLPLFFCILKCNSQFTDRHPFTALSMDVNVLTGTSKRYNVQRHEMATLRLNEHDIMRSRKCRSTSFGVSLRPDSSTYSILTSGL